MVAHIPWQIACQIFHPIPKANTKPRLLTGKRVFSFDISPLIHKEVAFQIQDSLRGKLPKTLYMAAKIGMLNPLCSTGNIRRNTAHTQRLIIDDLKSNNKNYPTASNLKLTRLGASFDSCSQAGNLFSKLYLHNDSPSPSPPSSPDCSICNSAPGLFTRARSYAGRRRYLSTGSGYSNVDSSSSTDSVAEHQC